jgi:hypothetical protein
MGQDSPSVDSLSAGATVFVGYVNRLLIIVDILWVAVVARLYIKIAVRSGALVK